jgi:hypothetical protein
MKNIQLCFLFYLQAEAQKIIGALVGNEGKFLPRV